MADSERLQGFSGDTALLEWIPAAPILQIKGYSLVTITGIGYFRGNLGLLSQFGSPLARLVVVQPQGGGRSQ
jgi:hypothetical protein